MKLYEQETTMTVVDQKRIARNTILLYIRMAVVALLGFWISREILDILKPVDNGIYSAIGDTVVMFSFLSNTMATACQRFFSFELGKSGVSRLRSIFSQCVIIFAIIILILIILTETVGLWFLNNKMDLAGREQAAFWVFQCATTGFIFQVLRTPYLGMIIAKEKMDMFAWINIFEVLGKFAIVFMLRNADYDKLVFYAILMMGVQILTSFICWLYCRRSFVECNFTIHTDRSTFMSLFSFTGWEMIGSFAGVCKTYGINVLINPLFGPLLNTARGLAQKVYMTFIQLQTNFFMAAKPQIIKSYAAGEKDEMQKLLFQSRRLTYYLLLVIAIPIFFETDTLLDIWLKDVPDYTAAFTRLILINGLVDTFSNPLASAIQATGKNKWYQICMGTTLLAILPVSYICCAYLGMSVFWMFYISITFSLIALFVRAYFVKKQTMLDMKLFLKEVVFTVIKVTVLSILVPLIIRLAAGDERTMWQSLAIMAISVLSTCVVAFFVGMTKTERKHTVEAIVKFKNKILCRQ